MTYIPEETKVIYQSKDGKDEKVFDALEWMKVISMIEDEDVIKKILKHLGLWEVKPRPPPKAIGPPITVEHHIDYSVSQIPASDNWLYVDPVYPEIVPS